MTMRWRLTILLLTKMVLFSSQKKLSISNRVYLMIYLINMILMKE